MLQSRTPAQRELPPTLAPPATAELAEASQRRPWLVMLGAGLLAGSLDLLFAFVFYGFQGATPERILRGIAAGVLGHDAFTLGSWTIALGAALHFLIAVSAATIFYIASRRLPVLTRRWLACGAAFGVAMYLAMHFIVIPLSRLHFRLPSLHNAIGELFSHIFLFGIVIAFGAARARAAQLRALAS